MQYVSTDINFSVSMASTSVPPGAEPLAVVLLSRLSETVNDQLRVGSESSVCTTFVALEVVFPRSLHARVQQC